MGFENIVFYVFAAIMVFSASMVITVKNPVQASLFLVSDYFSACIRWRGNGFIPVCCNDVRY